MKALALYRDAPLRTRLHTRARAAVCPLGAVLACVPREGALLDVGCGHGLFANEVALTRADVRVLGVDPSREKVRAAEATVRARANIAFRVQTIEEVPERDFDVLTVLDVLYLVQRTGWAPFLRACRERLRPEGRLLLKEVDMRPRWKFYGSLARETLSVRVLRITLGSELAFAGQGEMCGELARAGLRVTRVTDLARGYLSPHVLYEARRA